MPGAPDEGQIGPCSLACESGVNVHCHEGTYRSKRPVQLFKAGHALRFEASCRGPRTKSRTTKARPNTRDWLCRDPVHAPPSFPWGAPGHVQAWARPPESSFFQQPEYSPLAIAMLGAPGDWPWRPGTLSVLWPQPARASPAGSIGRLPRNTWFPEMEKGWPAGGGDWPVAHRGPWLAWLRREERLAAGRVLRRAHGGRVFVRQRRACAACGAGGERGRAKFQPWPRRAWAYTRCRTRVVVAAQESRCACGENPRALGFFRAGRLPERWTTPPETRP